MACQWNPLVNVNGDEIWMHLTSSWVVACFFHVWNLESQEVDHVYQNLPKDPWSHSVVPSSARRPRLLCFHSPAQARPVGDPGHLGHTFFHAFKRWNSQKSFNSIYLSYILHKLCMYIIYIYYQISCQISTLQIFQVPTPSQRKSQLKQFPNKKKRKFTQVHEIDVPFK